MAILRESTESVLQSLQTAFEIPEIFVGTDDIEHMVFERVANIAKALESSDVLFCVSPPSVFKSVIFS